MSQISIGQFIPGRSILHQLDPRAKLFFVFSYMILIFFANNVTTYSMLLVFTGLCILLSQISLGIYIKALKGIFYLIIAMIILHLLFTKGGEILVRVGFLTVYEEGFRQAIFISLRLLLLVLMASILTFTTSPLELTDAFESMLKPFVRFGLPAHEFALMMSMALRFIPTLWDETERIKKAQMARGADFESGSLFRRLKSYVFILIPLFISIFRRADELAMAMEARCYRGGPHRTKLRQLHYSSRDLALPMLLLLLIIGIWLLRK